MVVAPRDILEEVAGFLDFTAGDAQLLEAIGPLVQPQFHPIVDRFYDAIRQSPGASLAITGGEAQIERLKGTLRQWLAGIVGGVYDQAYLEMRSRIGRVHVRVGLDQRYMFGAMNILREGLHRAFDQALDALGDDEWPVQRVRDAHAAIDKICDMELAIMLETYREDYITRIRGTERLATLGQLAASIGHELRNPLAVVETSLHLLRRQVVGNPRAERHFKRIGEQVVLCGTIINDLLEMARDRPPQRAMSDVRSLVHEAVRGLPHREDVTFELDLPDDLPQADIDPGQIRQLLVNLTMNAVQAVRSGDGTAGTVRVKAEATDGRLVLRVEDDGPGLSPEAQARLFEPLFTTRSKGIGLGLALCRRIVDKHGGTIAGRNRPEGGARFEVSLPLQPEGQG
ncbi:MAG: protoglobin domain-containing protein [Myxococcota bacterium]